MKVRHKGFSRVLLPKPHEGILKDAGVTPLRVLRCLENPSGAFDESSWAFACHKQNLCRSRYALSSKRAWLVLTSTVSIVLGCFQKGDGRNGQHGWILSAPNIHSLSNIGVQLFEYAHLQVFRAVHDTDARLQTKPYELIQARQLLTVLQNTPRLSLSVGAHIRISEEDRIVYQLLEGRVSGINLALKYISSRKADECMDIDSEAVEQE